MIFNQNWIGLFEAMSDYFDEARYWREDGIFVGVTGLTMSVFNAAILEKTTYITAEQLASLDAMFRGMNLPYSIQTCHVSRNPPLEALMDDRGYVEMFCDPLMICEGPLDLPPLNPAVTITEVQSRAEQSTYSQVIIKGFDLIGSSQEFIDFMLSITTSYHVLAWMDGEAVGAGSVIYSGGVAGVYNVATIPRARRRGVALAVMSTLHTNALLAGYSGTALAASAMGLALYKRLGYRLDGYQIAYMPGGL